MRRDLSRLRLVRIGRPVPRAALEALADRILRACGSVVRSARILDYEQAPVDRIEAALLTQALEEDVGGHILAITDADLFENESEDFFSFMFGCKDQRNDVAVVSTHRFGEATSRRTFTRLLKVGLHELGHNFGLVHHYDYIPAIDGGCCPMTKGDFNRHGERSYLRAVVDERGFEFCEPCRRFLRLAHGS